MEEDFDTNADKALHNYVKEEMNIYSKNTFEELKGYYGNTEDLTIYRGVNFKTRLEYHRFMKKINEDEGYISNSAAGFSRLKDTAMDFAETTKTYYPSLETMQAEDKRRREGEQVSGYCGILLKTTIKKYEGIDVNRSPYGIEDEILLEPSKLIKCEVEVVKNYRNLVNQKDFDINEYIQKCNNTKDPIFNFITINYSERINNDSANHILCLCVHTEEEKDTLIENRLNKKNSRETLIHNGDNLTVIMNPEYETLSRDAEIVDKYYFHTPSNIQKYEELGCFRPDQYKKIKDISNNILMDFLEVHHSLGQKENIHSLYDISWFAKFANDSMKDTYQQNVLNKKGSEYHDLNDNIRDINHSDLTRAEKEERIKEYSDNITGVLNKILEQKMDKPTQKTKRLSAKTIK
jgi:hypothetical protein